MGKLCASDGPLTVVVVEDDADLLHSLQFCLDLEGWNVISYPTAEALLAGKALPGNGCLVLDHVLPGASGLELLSQLRALGSALPAIVITTDPGPALRTRAANLNATIVEKPLLNASLTDAIRLALSSSLR